MKPHYRFCADSSSLIYSLRSNSRFGIGDESQVARSGNTNVTEGPEYSDIPNDSLQGTARRLIV